MGSGMLLGMVGSSSYSFSSAPPADLLAIEPAWSYNSVTESNGAQGFTDANTDGATVGGLVSWGDDQSFIRANSDGARPVLAFNLNGRAVQHIYNGTSTMTIVPGWKKASKRIHQLGLGTILVNCVPTGTSGVRAILCNNRISGSSIGICVGVQDSTNKPFIQVTNGTAQIVGGVCNDALTVNANNTILIKMGGFVASGGTGTGTISVNGGTPTSFTISGTPSSSDATDDLTIGRHSSTGTNYWPGKIGTIRIHTVSYDTAQTTTANAWNPARTDLCPLPWGSGSIADTYCMRWYDMVNTAMMFQDTSAATPALVASDPVKLIKHRWSGMDLVDLTRNMTGSGATDPTLQIPTNSPIPLALRFNASANTDLFTMSPAAPSVKKWTLFIAGINNDATVGSRFVMNSIDTGSYLTITGTNYVATGPRAVAHDTSAHAVGGTAEGNNLRAETYPNIVALVRDGLSVSMYENGVHRHTATDWTGAMTWNAMGQGSIDDDPPGYFALKGYGMQVAYVAEAWSAGRVAQATSYYENLFVS